MVVFLFLLTVVLVLVAVRCWSFSVSDKVTERAVEYVRLHPITNANLRASGQTQQSIGIAAAA